MSPGEGLHRYGWRKLGPHAKDARGPFEGVRETCQPMTKAAFLRLVDRWNANGCGWQYWAIEDVVEGELVPPCITRPEMPFPHYNAARDGWTVKALADYLTQYARNNPDAIVRFTSCGLGGYWPPGRGPMGFFTDHQAAVVDGSRVGEGVTFQIALISFDGKR